MFYLLLLQNYYCIIAYVFFLKVCMKLGWKSKRTNFDILPIVLSANSHEPEWFELPPEIILEVKLEHPT